MKRGDLLNVDHHVLRYVKNRQIIRDDDGNVLGLYPDALALREDEEYLSVNWCQLFGEPIDDTVVSQCIASVKQYLTVTSKSIFALGNVDVIHSVHSANSGKRNLRIKYWPDARYPTHNPSHSAIFNLDQGVKTLNNLAKDAFYNYYDSLGNPIPII